MTYTIHDAHRDGRHASTNALDRGFWVGQGCTGCANTLPGDVPDTTVEWVFEGADPEVGIFGDLIVHPCAANEDEEPATEEVHHYPSIDPKIVNEATTFTCPACGATTTSVAKFPADWFVEPGREPAMFEVVHAGVVAVEL